METRALIAFVLSIAILVGYQLLLVRQGPRSDRSDSSTPAEPAPHVQAPESAPLAAPVPTRAKTAIETLDDASEPETLVSGERDRFEAVFTSKGGRIKNFRLRDYREHAAKDSPALDMVAADRVLPLGLYWRRPDGSIGSDHAVSYAITREITADGALLVKLEGTGPGGERISKELRAENGSYALAYTASVETSHEISIGVSWSHRVPDENSRFGGVEGPVVFLDQSLEASTSAALTEPVTHRGKIDWAGYGYHYFLAAYFPEEPATLRFSGASNGGDAESTLWSDQATDRVSYHLYVGPKRLSELKLLGHRLDEAVDLGWFAFIARPMLELMIFLNKITGNYGWSIILLTMAVRLVFYPINKRQAVAMKAMQRIQPELKRIQEKFKDDRERLNKELMDVYRRHKVNPLAGCLPMLLQLPVFLGLYNALMQAIELRHAPFIGWIGDLSQPDRLGTLAIPFVTPPGIPVLTLLMGASMVIQQRMMPAAGDPTQQRVMMLMPVIFTVMFINFPSGLVLYWFANNLMSIAQQYLTNRTNN